MYKAMNTSPIYFSTAERQRGYTVKGSLLMEESSHGMEGLYIGCCVLFPHAICS